MYASRRFFKFVILLCCFISLWIGFGGLSFKEEPHNQNLPIKSFQQVQVLTTKTESKFNFTEYYPLIKSCNFDEKDSADYKKYFDEQNIPNDYSSPAPEKTHDMRIIRGLIFYMPLEQINYFAYEIRWLYRSWIEMQKYEPLKWRTDLIIFANRDSDLYKDEKFILNELNCTFFNRRTSKFDKPMCTLIEYKPLKDRQIDSSKIDKYQDDYELLLKKINIFDEKESNIEIFYSFLKTFLSNYGYVDSILVGFEGYEYFKSAGFNFLIRSDMDVFLTPLFAKWLPKKCNDFYVGRGGYSNIYNSKKLKRIAKGYGLESAEIWNLGSTWYSTPEQFRLVSYLTLFGMAALSKDEFSQPERELKLGVLLWPDWHYGVLLLYGQNLVMNHLIKTNQLNIVKLEEYMDHPSAYSTDVNKIIHIHVFHGPDLFSKFDFKDGKYDSMTVNESQTNLAKYYSLKMALEGKKFNGTELTNLLSQEIFKKI
ncbi:unnamed protein product [Brachionus calyciflorus]|uniref:DUF7164 domain-containing protein n=1 Tax=Brachionus calyciflorus TaxID=104777 RepID=A0A813MLU4_9BILA|nr:unnamed protein product [Brachionus calyciflorus]